MAPVPIQTPQELLTAIPYLLQYQPHDSLVVAFARDGRLTHMVVLDFSPPLASSDLWATLALNLAHHHPDSVYLIAYFPESLVPTIMEYARTAPLPVTDVLRVRDGLWWGLFRDDPSASPLGTSLEPQEHVVAPFTMAGHSVAASWAELAAFLRSAPKPDLDRVQAEIARTAGEMWTATDRYRALWTAHEARRDGPVALDHIEAARLLRALSHAWVVDACLDWHDDASWWLWSDLIRLTPTHRIPTVAVLLATAAYQRGDATLAKTAAQHALRADPEFLHAQAILIALIAGLPTDQFSETTHQTAEWARTQLRTLSARRNT